MDIVEAEPRAICDEVNLRFRRSSKKKISCIVCSSIDDGFAMRSNFWIQATYCSAGHRQATFVELGRYPKLGLCEKCNYTYVFGVLNRKYTCRREGCRRIVRVDEAAVREKLSLDKNLLASVLLQKCMHAC